MQSKIFFIQTTNKRYVETELSLTIISRHHTAHICATFSFFRYNNRLVVVFHIKYGEETQTEGNRYQLVDVVSQHYEMNHSCHVV